MPSSSDPKATSGQELHLEIQGIPLTIPLVPRTDTPDSNQDIPSEGETRKRLMNLQKQMGLPTEDEINPLGPGAYPELYPGGPDIWYPAYDPWAIRIA